MKVILSLDLIVNLIGCSVCNDYGVLGLFVWYEVEDIEIEMVYLFDCEWSYEELEVEFGNFVEWIIDMVEMEDFEVEV